MRAQSETAPPSSTLRANRPVRASRLVASLLLAVVAALNPACSTTSEPPAPSDTRLGQLQRMIDRGDHVKIDRKSGGTESFKVTRVTSDGISGKDASRNPVNVPLDDIRMAAVRANEKRMPQAGGKRNSALGGVGKIAGHVVGGAAAMTAYQLATDGVPWLLFMF